MIRRVYSPEELSILPENGIEARKIRALLMAYGTKYEFCRFYVSEGIVLCETDGSFVLCEYADSCGANELAEFLAFHGYSEIFCSLIIGEKLAGLLNCSFKRVNLMRFCGEGVPCGTVDTSPPLDDVFEILKTSFDIEYEPWYADMSHRIRHGVSSARVLDNSALIVQYDFDGEALLSQVATVPEHRGRGGASRLIKAVCAELSSNDVYVLCEDRLLPFYCKVGFDKISQKMILTRSEQE